MQLTALFHYPVKSMRGNPLQQAAASACGLPHDREWLLTDPDGKFLTARKLPQLLLWQAAADEHGLTLTAPDGDTLHTACDRMQQQAEVNVWKDHFSAQYGSAEADEWLSRKLGQACRLFWLGAPGNRRLPYSDGPLSFADGAPFLLANEASLAALNQTLDEPVEMARFRANLVIDGQTAYEEEQWQRIRIGEVTFELFKPCVRCVMTTVDLHTAQLHPQQQPLATLAKTRRAIFGMNMIALNSGTVTLGDRVEILA